MNNANPDKIRVLIVDDETAARRRLMQFLSTESDVSIIGECKDGLSACTEILRLTPDLVFLDVEMPELNGLDVVAQIGIQRMPVTIFATAYDHYALSAFEANAMDYLLKPFDQERFSKAMQKARMWIRMKHAEYQAQLKAVLTSAGHTKNFYDRILVRSGEAHRLIKTTDILYVSAEGNYIRLHTLNGTHQMRERMVGILDRLNPLHFRRIHRSHIVNLDHVKKLLPWYGGDFLVLMTDDSRLTLSRSYRDALQEFM